MQSPRHAKPVPNFVWFPRNPCAYVALSYTLVCMPCTARSAVLQRDRTHTEDECRSSLDSGRVPPRPVGTDWRLEDCFICRHRALETKHLEIMAAYYHC